MVRNDAEDRGTSSSAKCSGDTCKYECGYHDEKSSEDEQMMLKRSLKPYRRPACLAGALLWGGQERVVDQMENRNRKPAGKTTEKKEVVCDGGCVCSCMNFAATDERAEPPVPSMSEINMATSLFRLPLTASTTSRCRPSPSRQEGYVIRLTRPAGFLLSQNRKWKRASEKACSVAPSEWHELEALGATTRRDQQSDGS